MSLRLSIHTFLICIFGAITPNVNGQSFFINLPNVGGINMQGVCRGVVPLDSAFAVIGHRYDTTGPGSVAKPWIGNFNYDGEMELLSPLIDTIYEEPFNLLNVIVCHKDGDNYYSFSRRLNPLTSNYTPYVFELNIWTGEILKSKLLTNQAYPEMPNGQTFIYFENNEITLLSYVQVDNEETLDSLVVFINIVDTLFNSLESIQVKSSALRFSPRYIKKDTDSTYQIVGIEHLDPLGSNSHWRFSYLRINSHGYPLEEKLIPWDKKFANHNPSSRTIMKDSDNNWIIGGYETVYYPDSCFNCAVYIPYVISVTDNFDSLLWSTRFFDIPYKIGDYYTIYSMTAVEDGYIVAGEFFNLDIDLYPDSGLLFKADLNGDSLWMKHYIPVGWDGYRVAQMLFYDVKTTPLGTIIAVGNLGDRNLNIIRPVIMHVDKDGCLVPGCNEITGTENVDADQLNLFKIFPNPASDELFVLSQSNIQAHVEIHLSDQRGVILHRSRMVTEHGAQYIFPIEHLLPGIYHIVFKTDANVVESHSFIKS